MKEKLDSFSKSLSAASLESFPERLFEEGEKTLKEVTPSLGVAPVSKVSQCSQLLGTVIPLSLFVKTLIQRRPALLRQILDENLLNTSLPPEKIKEMADTELLKVQSEEEFAKRIRLFRNMLMLRIAIRDMGGLSPFSETCLELSTLACVCLETVIKWLERQMARDFGFPQDSKGEILRLIVLGMGKLGAGELNFSSDIDLIFAFRGKGCTSGGSKSISNHEYFLHQCQRLMAILSRPMPEGFVFRVDTRLRPFGDSGPLVMTMDAMLEYYERQGRQWERYALVKARPVAGDVEGGWRLLEELRPFVYRKYIDYSAIESLKEMKAMIVAEQAEKAGTSNVKLGPGGIRDIEFVIQTFQLIKGGRIKALQVQSLIDALEVIKRLGLLSEETCWDLARAYVWLRVTENRLQEYHDRQVQTLPGDGERRYRLALSLGYPDWDHFLDSYHQHTKNARSVFQGLFHEEGEDGQQEDGKKDQARPEALFVWSSPEDPRTLSILEGFGFSNPGETSRLIYNFRESKKVKSLPGQVQELLDRLVPNLLLASASTTDPDKAFTLGLSIFEAVLKRSIYLVLLDQNPEALEHLVFLCSRSRLIGELLRRQPILLDELVSTDSLFREVDKEGLKRLLLATIEALTRKDLEHWLDELRRFKKAQVLRIAASQLKGIMGVENMGISLTNLAEVILEEAFRGAWQDMAKRRPAFVEGTETIQESGLAVIAYGKLGSRELSYSSDLDLVFLYQPERFGHLNQAQRGELGYFYSRLIQRLLFFLSARTSQGVLYEIDTRLRPNGSQGILVSTVSTFNEYQLKKAWTWEHQALIRARFLCGDKDCGRRFESIRTCVIRQERDAKRLKEEIVKMRGKIIKSHVKRGGEGLFHLKKSPGGLVDIEFIAQYLVLRHASIERRLADCRDTRGILTAIGEAGYLTKGDVECLRYAHSRYQELINLKALDMEKPVVPLEELDDIRKGVLETWNRLFG